MIVARMRAAVAGLRERLFAPAAAYECHVINLARQPDRYAAFMRINGPTGLRFNRFDAVDGQVLSREEAIAAGVLSAAAAGYSPGMIGCAASHRLLWQRAQSRQANLLVFEDDVYCRRDIVDRLHDVMAAQQNWDVILFGFNTDARLDFRAAENLDLGGHITNRRPKPRHLEIFAEMTAPVRPFRLNNAFGSCAYLVSPGGAQKLLTLFPMDNRELALRSYEGEEDERLACSSIDALMNTLYRNIEAYVTIPPLALPLNDHAASNTR